MFLSATLILVSTIGTADAFPHFAKQIPNGYSVPNPEPQGGVWAGVGHVTAGGNTERNQFGLDFKSNMFEWTTELCKKDSDGDGRSNGEELGDPDCEWFVGETPKGPALSHPGIIDEPEDTKSVLNCDDYVAPDDEETMEIGFSTPNQLNSTQTHYRCEQKTMKVPDTKAYSLIKSSIMLDTSDILHHMFVFICPSTSTDGDFLDLGPYECSGIETQCVRIAGFAIGNDETCAPLNIGQFMDFTDSPNVIVKIEAHYDNTSGKNQQDMSGIRVHLTPTLRPLREDTLVTGMGTTNRDFEIPAQQNDFPISSICPSVMTNNLDHPIYVYKFNPHMHRYGTNLVTEHYRCGKKIGEIGRVNSYEFDNQQSYGLATPVKILPGDAMVTTCKFNTMQAQKSILGGEETSDEMCLNFLGYYPYAGTEEIPQKMSVCLSFERGILGRAERRFAIADRSGKTMSFSFESDPTLNIADCCATGTCESDHIATKGMACGASDDDCEGGLVCLGGLCSDKPPVDQPKEDNNDERDEYTSSSPLGVSNIAMALAVLTALIVGV